MAIKKKTSIRDIAEMAGVSISAVSRYLNEGYVSEEKKEAIRKAIEETDYSPSKQAQTLRMKKTKVIGVIVPRLESEAISRMLDGIVSELDANDYYMFVVETQLNPQKEIEYLSMLEHNPVDGIILFGTEYSKNLRNTLRKIQIPVVVVGQHFPNISCVYNDDEAAFCALTEHMIETGCKNIGCIGVNRKDASAGDERFQGYLEALKKHNLAFRPEMFEESEFNLEGGYAAAGKLLERNPKLDGIVCATDSIAIGAMRWLKETGLKIPDDVAVAGVGHHRISTMTTPKLTTVHFYYANIGRESVKMMMEMLESGELIEKQLKMEYGIIVGDSTRK